MKVCVQPMTRYVRLTESGLKGSRLSRRMAKRAIIEVNPIVSGRNYDTSIIAVMYRQATYSVYPRNHHS